MQSAIPLDEHARLRTRIAGILGLTLLFELAGATALFFSTPRPADLPAHIHWALFHAVSAFCNAGLALQTDSLEGFAGNLPVNAIIMGLIIAGGLGFLVLPELVTRAADGVARAARRLCRRRPALVPRPRPLS